MSCFLFSQKENINYKIFDQEIGLNNTDLSYGVVYKEKYRTKKNNHNCFINNNYSKGIIVYRNQAYHNVSLKYDIFEDEIILRLADKYKNLSIVLEKDLVSEFSIYNSEFINNTEYGFLQVLKKNSKTILFKKHFKKKYEKIENGILYHEFVKKENFLIFYRNEYSYVNTKRDFMKVFPQLKKQINTFFKNNQILKNNNFEGFTLSLFNKLMK